MAKRQMKSEPELTDSDEVVEMDEAVVEEVSEVVPDPDTHVFLGGAMLDIKDIGLDNPRERRISFGGANWEHTDEHESGCWRYRQM